MQGIMYTPLSLLIVQMIVIISASRLIGRGAKWMGQPLVIAEVVAGILLGPSLLGWLAPDALNSLFPASSMPVLKMLSQVGLILFMFLIGLELDPGMLKGRGHTSVAISHTSIVVPFALGAAVAFWLYERLSDPSVPFSSFMLFMGVAMSITAFPVLARILSERGLLRSRVGMITLTCAAVDDVTAWCLLAFIASIVRATDLADAGYTTVFALIYIGIMLGLLRPFLKRLGARVSDRQGLTQNAVALTLILLLASAWITEQIGIHALFGAFLFGTIIPKEGGLAEALAEKLEDVTVVLLLPLFFAYSGLRTQIGLLSGGSDWAICGIIILLACLGKFGGSTVAARLTGLRWREAGALGILMNTRGLMELIVLNLGLDLGVISPKLFTMMVIMALVTTFMTTPLLRWIYPPEELAKDQVPLPPVAVPAGQVPFTVLMCVSHGQAGTGMATLGRALAGVPSEPFQVYALHLAPPTGRISTARRLAQEPPSGDALAPLMGRASTLGLEVRPLSFVSAEPGLDICRTAEAKQANLILLGLHKPLFSRALLGGTVREVMQEATANVAVLVDRGLENVRRVLVPFIGSQHDQAALSLAKRLMRSVGAELTVLQVNAPGHGQGDSKARASAEALFSGESRRAHFKEVTHDSPEDAALEEARNGYDLVVVGVGSEWGLENSVFGLHRERLIGDAPTSLLVVRHPSSARTAQRTDKPGAAQALPTNRVV
jgi:Kef-type K+ transport system membrane component KefB/nucleotide-binding universal stress UspA family protein